MTTNTTSSREEMISAIYEKIADETLSFGCKFQLKTGAITTATGEPSGNFITCLFFQQTRLENIEKIIGHPVMIGDVMDFIERNFPDGIHCIECKKGKILSDNFNDDTIFYCDNEDCEFLSKFYGDEAFCHNMELYDGFWEEKRKPIEEQSDECIEFIYNLIS